MNLKALATPYAAGGMTFWMIGWRIPAVDSAITALELIRPHICYVNTATGAQSASEPTELKKAREKAAKLNYPLKSDWERRDLWTSGENAFCLVLPRLVDVDFPDADALTQEQRAFKAWWGGEFGKSFQERWEAFNTVVSSAIINLLWDAYAATEDNPAPALPELSQDAPADTEDPQALSDGELSTTTTISS